MKETQELTTPDIREGLPSASGIERIALCPGSYRMEQALPAPPPSQEATDGTRLHEHMEKGSLPTDPEEAEAVDWCVRTEMQLMRELLGEGQLSQQREQRLWLKDNGGGKLMSGQADLVAISEDKKQVLIIDYKFGRGDVMPAQKNMQLLALAVLVAEAAAVVPDTIYCAILQPYASRQTPAVASYSKEALTQAKAELVQLLRKASQEMQPLRASDKACKYCRAAARCPQVQASISSKAQTGLAWSNATPAEKGQALQLAAMAKKWADKINALAKADLAQGLEVEGFQLGKGRESYKVTDPAAAYIKLASCLALPADVFASCCTVSISQLDKAVHELRQTSTKTTVKESKEWLRATLAECGEVKTTEGSIIAQKS